MILEHIPKTSYVSLSQLQLGVFDVISNFNVGRRVSILIYEFMNIIPSKDTLLGCNRIIKAWLQDQNMILLSLSKTSEKLDAEKQSKKMIKMIKRRGKQVKLEHFNASKSQKHIELSYI